MSVCCKIGIVCVLSGRLDESVYESGKSLCHNTVRKRIRIPCGILIQDGDRSVTLQTIIAYFSSKSAFKLKNHVPMNKIELPLHPETHK